ncbi:flagellar hook capping FlgD N-terminal domain-containing protein [uncultured Desulfobulbus sp.]|uniref:flagellar hook assembly protein FlgD n=1 Tax=uncultured Desulfobulbus sp. TaxID=239745 RepID=UPI0029C86087|nr:flagellar hook capping FlgD N-terminal domain-containing protein [uncultured Desulfobulbus sp.]
MTTIPGITNTSTTTASKTTSKASALGQDQFLTLLVAQLQNQDPLNPTDATEFTAQLAQYSQLEQLFNLNDSMDKLASAQNSSERLSALSLIGQDVVVEESEFTLGAQPVEIGYKIDGTVTSANLQIKNSSGKTVATLTAKDLSAGDHYLAWDGKDSSGNTLASGKYSITIDAKSADGKSATVAPLVRSKVTGIDLSGTEAQIVTALGEYKISSIHGAYNSDQSATTGNSG